MQRSCLILFALTACAPRSGMVQDTSFAITYPDAAHARVKTGEHFHAPPAGRCFYDDGREARWTTVGAKIASGELPPGMTIEDGVIGGVSKQPGSYHATIVLREVNCAGKTYPDQTVEVQITVK